MIYLAAVFALTGSLHWSPKLTAIAGLASIPPYGTLVFELIMAHRRRNESLASYRQIVVRAIIMNKAKLLAVQPSSGVFWCLPGGIIEQGESALETLKRTVYEQAGISPSVGQLAYISQYRHHGIERLELFFVVTNSDDFKKFKKTPTKRGNLEIDEIAFIDRSADIDLRPSFLLNEDLTVRQRTVQIIPT